MKDKIDLKDKSNLEKKEKLKDLRRKKAENEENIKEVRRLNENCYALSEQIKYENEKNIGLKTEIEYRIHDLKEKERQYSSVVDQNNPDSKKYVIELKNSMIKNKLEELLLEKMPELNTSNTTNGTSNFNKQDNEFYDLIFDNITLLYTQYDSNDPSIKSKEDKQSFRVSKDSTFKFLKQIACAFWDIDNDNDYAITDEAEALIYNEDMKIDGYLRDYSPLVNVFRLMSISALKTRSKLIGIQEHRMKEVNKLYSKDKSRKKDNKNEVNSAYDSSAHKIKDFFNSDYPGLKPYLLSINEEKSENTDKPKREDAHSQANKIETSFFMLLVLVIFFVLNIMFIYNTRDIAGNNYKIEHVSKIFDNKNVTDYISLYDYLISTISMKLLDPNIEYLEVSDRNNFLNNTYNIYKNKSWFQVEINPETKQYNLLTDSIPEYMNQIQNNNKFEIVSSIRFILNRVVQKPSCSNNTLVANVITRNDRCFSEYYKAPFIEETFTLDNGYITDSSKFFQDFISRGILNKFLTAKQANVTLDISSISGKYDGSGYHFDIPLNSG